MGLALAPEASDSGDISSISGSDMVLASTPVRLNHGKQLAKPLLNVRLTGRQTGLCVHPDMLSQLRFIDEAFPAVITGKGPLGPMDALVPPHVTPLPKVLVTLGAAEGSLSSVQALVAEQLSLQAEALVTGGTLEGLLSSVCADMLGELGLLGKALTAGAGEGHLPTVQQLMSPHVCLHSVTLVALRALEGPLPCVQAPVAD